jgi:hypothetical protein
MLFLKGVSTMSVSKYTLLFVWIMVLIFTNVGFATQDLGVYVDRLEDPEKTDKCRYCGKHIKAGNIHKDAERIIMNRLKEGLMEKGVGYVEGKERTRYINVFIYRFEERRGGNFAADKPAGVGFHMHLIEDNNIIRIFVFDETQQALSENVLNIGKFFRRGGKWLTAGELSEEGIKKGLDYLLENIY